MKIIERVFEIIDKEGINQVEFCKRTALNPVTFSSIKTKNTDLKEEYIVKIKLAYPKLNLDWLILGEGEMWEKEKPASISLQVQNNHTVDSVSVIHEQKAIYGADPFGQCRKEVEMLQNTLRDKEEIISLLKQQLQK